LAAEKEMMNILVVYDQYSTHTNTVHEHLQALGRFSSHQHLFYHCGRSGRGVEWSSLDALVIHYSARLISHSVSSELRLRIARFRGTKVLFVQDEYDLTEHLRELILALGIDLVFTCVPPESIETIYPAARFPDTRFTSTLTGFAPVDPLTPDQWADPTERPLLVGYRGRALPFWYGDLGQEKQEIAERFRLECEKRSLPCDIEWDDRHRIYGDAWPRFMGNCRATLGTESGSNLFDDDGSLRRRFKEWQVTHPSGRYAAARKAVLGDAVERPLMNQISPRIFEAIASGTALVLYEGSYSGVVQPEAHYIPLRKDFSNIDGVFAVLNDPAALRAMTRRAYRDVIESGAWSYQTFVADYDWQIEQLPSRTKTTTRALRLSGGVTNEPVRQDNVRLPPVLAALWRALPVELRTRIYPFARAFAITCRRLLAVKQKLYG
jgi:hypothetical protein